jgi:hypothetical protein
MAKILAKAHAQRTVFRIALPAGDSFALNQCICLFFA